MSHSCWWYMSFLFLYRLYMFLICFLCFNIFLLSQLFFTILLLYLLICICCNLFFKQILKFYYFLKLLYIPKHTDSFSKQKSNSESITSSGNLSAANVCFFSFLINYSFPNASNIFWQILLISYVVIFPPFLKYSPNNS